MNRSQKTTQSKARNLTHIRILAQSLVTPVPEMARQNDDLFKNIPGYFMKKM